jgi:hypothetical protein
MSSKPNWSKNRHRRCVFPSFHCGFFLTHIRKGATPPTSTMLKKNVIGHLFVFLLHEYICTIWFIRSTPPFVMQRWTIKYKDDKFGNIRINERIKYNLNELVHYRWRQSTIYMIRMKFQKLIGCYQNYFNIEHRTF